MRLHIISAVFLLVGLAVVTAAQEEDHPAVDPVLGHRAEALILARCSVCHTPDLISQQRLPPERWTVTVEKMVHWGAELTNDEASVLIQYLTARYHPAAPDHLPPLNSELGKSEPLTQEPVAIGPLTGVASRGSTIYAHNCQACHGEGAMGLVGPKLTRSGILKDEGAFWETVLHGRGPMPAWEAVLSHQDIADVHAWLSAR